MPDGQRLVRYAGGVPDCAAWGQPVLVRGKLYPSQVAAAQDLGVDPSTVSRALQRGRPDTLGLGMRPPVPIVVRGTCFASISEAARALGVTQSTVSGALRRGSLDNIGLGRWPVRLSESDGVGQSDGANSPGR